MNKTFIFCVLLAIPCFMHVSAVDLAYNLKVGSSYVVATSNTVKLNMNVMGMNVELGNDITSRITYTVNAETDNGYDIDVRYDSVMIASGGMLGDQNLNTGQTMDQIKHVLNSFIGKSFQITLSKKGKVMDVKNYENLFSGLDAFGQSNGIDTQFAEQLKQSFSEEAFLSNMSSYMSYFPATSVNKGDSWTTTNKQITSGIPVEAVTTYTLKEITGNRHIISGNTVLKSEQNGNSTMMIQGMPANLDIKGGINFEMALDKKTGWLNEMTGKIDMDASVEMFIEPLQNQSVKMKITGDIVSSDH